MTHKRYLPLSIHMCICAHVYNLHRGVVSTLERRDYIYVLESSMGSGTSLDTNETLNTGGLPDPRTNKPIYGLCRSQNQALPESELRN